MKRKVQERPIFGCTIYQSSVHFLISRLYNCFEDWKAASWVAFLFSEAMNQHCSQNAINRSSKKLRRAIELFYASKQFRKESPSQQSLRKKTKTELSPISHFSQLYIFEFSVNSINLESFLASFRDMFQIFFQTVNREFLLGPFSKAFADQIHGQLTSIPIQKKEVFHFTSVLKKTRGSRTSIVS